VNTTQDLFQTLSSWAKLFEVQKRALCHSIIDHFDKPVVDVGEIAALAEGFVASGDKWGWPSQLSPLVDVPSTGGPGSLTTLLCPYLLAANGCFVPKVSVPGSTAGAIDVLNLVRGFRCELSQSDMLRCLKFARIAHSSNTSSLAPADGYLFALRSEIGKKSIPALVIASLLSKKMAVSCEKAVVDVRCRHTGNLGIDRMTCILNSRLFATVAKNIGIELCCVVTDIDELRIPFIGRSESLFALERLLSVRHFCDLDIWLLGHLRTCIQIAAEALVTAKLVEKTEEATARIETSLLSGKVKEVFLTHLRAQGAQEGSLEELLSSYASHPREAIVADRTGYLQQIDIEKLCRILRSINGSRPNQNDRVGFQLLKRKGDAVKAGDPIISLRSDGSVVPNELHGAKIEVLRAMLIGEQPTSPPDGEVIAVVRLL